MKVKIDKVGEFSLANEGKLRRVIDGTTDARGNLIMGTGEKADPMTIITAYDKIGGLILGKEKAKVKTGSFYNFKDKKAHEKPEIVYTFTINRKQIEVREGDPLPLQVQAAHMNEQDEKEALKKKAVKEKAEKEIANKKSKKSQKE